MSRIPKILHYVFGMASDFGGKPWSLLHHACLKSAVERIKPAETFLYFEFEPSGPWWEASRAFVTPVKVKAPQEIFGKQLRHVAHRADVLRLQKLIEHGGIYLDADVFVHRDFDDLLDNSVVLGEEGIDGEHGIANAVMLAEPNAPFLRRWLDEYHWFRSRGEDKFWSEHSVKIPQLIARAHPDEITVLPYTAFFWPLWTEEHLRWIFGSREPISLEKSYCTHLWEGLSWRYVDGLTPGDVRADQTNFNLWARPLLNGLSAEYGSLSLMERLQRLRWRARRRTRQIKANLNWRAARLQAAAESCLLSERQLRKRMFSGMYDNELRGRYGYSRYSESDVDTETYANRLAELFNKQSTDRERPFTIVDLGCGDFRVGSALVAKSPNAVYIGCDIVPAVIAEGNRKWACERVAFQELDIIADAIPEGDVYLLRHVLQYLSNGEISRLMNKLCGKQVYVTEVHLAKRNGPANADRAMGVALRGRPQTRWGRSMDLKQPPFSLVTRELFRFRLDARSTIVTELVEASRRPTFSAVSA